MKKLKITLTRSLIGNKKDQRATVRALGLGTVSYTHLDVYKRQIERGVAHVGDAVEIVGMKDEKKSTVITGLETVSYTHLDVYKRPDRNSAK